MSISTYKIKQVTNWPSTTSSSAVLWPQMISLSNLNRQSMEQFELDWEVKILLASVN